MDEQNKALRQRIAVHYNIEPLSESETHDYIEHRIRIAGSEKKIFYPDAIYEIFSFSKGYPRLINTICDQALLTGYVLGSKKIDGKIVKKCAEELIIPGGRDETRNVKLKRPEIDRNQERDRLAYHEPSASLRNQVISRLKNIAKLHENLVINIVCEMGNQQRLRVANDLVEMIKAAKISVKLSTEQTFFLKPPPPIRMVYNPNNEDLFQKVISALEIYMGGKATRIREKEMLPSAMSLEFYGLPIFLNSTRVGFH